MTVAQGVEAALAEAAPDLLARNDTPGAAVAVAQQGATIFCGGLGLRDREAGLAPDGDTVFGCASITKMFTALAILLLQEDGRLRVDEPLTRYLPEFRLAGDAGDRVTAAHLLSHTAGLPPLPGRHYAVLAAAELEDWERADIEKLLARWPAWQPIPTYDGFLHFLAEYPYRLHGAPGERLSYSNEGYSLLGLLIERVAGVPYERFVAERILQPCGMTRSGVGLAPVLATDNATAPYARRDGQTVRTRAWFHAPALYSGGQLRSTANDLLRFLEMLRQQGAIDGVRVAAAETIAELTRPRVRIDDERWYGYGTIVRRYADGTTAIGHSGGHKGVASHAGFLPEAQISCAVLTNVEGGPAQELWDTAVFAAVGRPVPRPARRPAIDLAEAALARFYGRYGSGEGGVALRVARDEGALIVEAAGKRHEAAPVADDTLMWEEYGRPLEVRFVAAPGAAATEPFAWAFHGLRHQPRLPDED